MDTTNPEAKALLREIFAWVSETKSSGSQLGQMVLNHGGFVPLLQKRGSLHPDTATLIRAFMEAFPNRAELPPELAAKIKEQARAGSPWRPERHRSMLIRLGYFDHPSIAGTRTPATPASVAAMGGVNRALQQQIWALQDAQEAARAADELRKAWSSVGDSIMDEVRRIRGLSGIGGEGSFATLMGQFNAATTAARGGDIEAAKKLPGLSQAMLAAAEKAATSRQELDRIRAQTATTLESLAAAINGANPATGGTPAAALLQNMADVVSIATSASSDATATELRTGMEGLREELAQMRKENASGHAATAGNTGAIKRHLDNVTADSGGTAISTRAA